MGCTDQWLYLSLPQACADRYSRVLLSSTITPLSTLSCTAFDWSTIGTRGAPGCLMLGAEVSLLNNIVGFRQS